GTACLRLSGAAVFRACSAFCRTMQPDAEDRADCFSFGDVGKFVERDSYVSFRGIVEVVAGCKCTLLDSVEALS
ncbi:MAG: hypothetical protein QMB59_03235, partial [Bacteroidales bacterium]